MFKILKKKKQKAKLKCFNGKDGVGYHCKLQKQQLKKVLHAGENHWLSLFPATYYLWRPWVIITNDQRPPDDTHAVERTG